MSVSNADVDSSVSCSSLSGFCSDSKDPFKETIKNLNALNGREETNISGPNCLSETKDTSKLGRPLVISSSPDDKSHVFKEKFINGKVRSNCKAKEMSTDELIHNIDDLTENSSTEKEATKRDNETSTDELIKDIDEISTSSKTILKGITNNNMDIDNTHECMDSFDEDVGFPDKNTVSHQTKHSVNNCVSSMDCSDICENTLSCSKDTNTNVNSVSHSSVDSSSTNPENVKSDSAVLDKNKPKHSYDNVPFNPLTIDDKVRNSMRDIMYKLKQGKTPESTKSCTKGKSEDCVASVKSCDTTVQTDSKPSPRKDNLFESISEFTVKPKLNKSDNTIHLDAEDSQNIVNDKPDSEMSDKMELVSQMDELSNSKDSLENEISGAKSSDQDWMEEKAADASDASKDSEIQLIMTKSEDTYVSKFSNNLNIDSLSNSNQSDTCLIDECDDKKDADGSFLASASMPNTDQQSSCDDASQSASSETQSSIHKMDTGEFSSVSDNELKHPDLISDKVKENSKEFDSDELEDNSTHDETKSCDDTTKQDDTFLSTNEKKRMHDDGVGTEQPPKRSRLDEVIGKLGSVIGISPETVEQVDSDSESEDSRPSESSEVKSEADDVTSVSDEDDDKISQATSQSSTKTIRLSSKELEALIRSKVQSYMNAHKDEEMTQLQKKITELQESNDKWKTEARDLQKQVVDLTVLKQKLEKRKAATAALKQITSKCVGVQVSLDELKQTMSAVAQRLAKTPPKSGSVSFSSPLPQSSQASQNPMSANPTGKPNSPAVTLTSSTVATRNNVTQLLTATAMPRISTAATTASTPPVPSSAGVRPQLTQHLNNANNTVRSLLDNARVDTVRFQGVVPNSVGSSLLVVNPVPQNTAKTSVNSIPKVIDLTADDESQSKQGQLVQTLQVLPGANTSQLRPATLQQLLPQQVIRQMGPQPRQTAPISGTSILLSSPAGTQIINNNLNRPQLAQGATYQVVTIASGPNIRPGTLLTMVPATSTQLSSVRPQSVSVAKQVNSQSMPQLRAGQPTQPTQLTYTTSARPSQPVQSMRPPPPLVSAPPPQSQSIVRVSAPSASNSNASNTAPVKHPAPLPTNSVQKAISGKPLPPRPSLKISRVSQGIVLSWNVTSTDNVSDITSYQLYAYQETNTPPSTSLWKKVGDVKALPLPMACTLTQFQEGNKYHFAVRAVDQSGRSGEFSEPSTIHLISKS